MHTHEEMEPRGDQRQELTVDRPLPGLQPPPQGPVPLPLSLLRTAREPSPLLHGLVQLAVDPVTLLQGGVRLAPGLARHLHDVALQELDPVPLLQSGERWAPGLACRLLDSVHRLREAV